MATVVGVAFAVLASYLIIKKRTLATQALDYVVVLPLTISGTVLGIALVQTFNTGWLVLAGTSTIMVLAYAVRRLPLPCAMPPPRCSTSRSRSRRPPSAWACRP
jgi:iron(III) transport system permease protein